MLAKINSSTATIGWTAWGGGKWWNTSYMFRLDPVNGVQTPHMSMVKNNVPK